MWAILCAVVGSVVPADVTSIGWGSLQSPPGIISSSCNGALVFGRVRKPGVTDAPGQGAGIAARLGSGPALSVPDDT